MTEQAPVPSGAARGTTRHGFERMVFFSDAVVAIAITLVVLPLVDAARVDAADGVGFFFVHNVHVLVAALVAFVWVSFLWRQHHRLLERATAYTPGLLKLNIWWLGSIAFLPVATMLNVSAPEDDLGGPLVYLATLMSASIALYAIWAVLLRHGLLAPSIRPVDDRVPIRLLPALALALAFATVLAAPGFPFWELVLVLYLPLGALLRRILTRRPRAAESPHAAPHRLAA